VKLHNKLLYNYRQILTPLAVNLERVNLKSLSNNTDLLEIHKQIAKLKEQTHVLARLKTKGFLDEAKYLEQTTELNSKTAKLQTEIKKLNVSDEEDETLEQLDMIIGYFEKRQKLMVEFEELAFESIVDKIVVKNQNELEFHLIGGLELAEEI
jgi:Asp-tRNA(Asn)/Glu-tRNA(Gln) amidotransferase C subunit